MTPHYDEEHVDGHNDETDSGLPERRRLRYVTWDEHIHLVVGLLIAFFVLMTLSSVGIYWAWNNGRKLERNGADAVLRSCVSRADLRVTVAVAIDQLRVLALREPHTAEERQAVSDFLARTQAPIDRLLSQAAGQTIDTARPGPLSERERRRVQKLAVARCEKQADEFRVGIGDG